MPTPRRNLPRSLSPPPNSVQRMGERHADVSQAPLPDRRRFGGGGPPEADLRGLDSSVRKIPPPAPSTRGRTSYDHPRVGLNRLTCQPIFEPKPQELRKENGTWTTLTPKNISPAS